MKLYLIILASLTAVLADESPVYPQIRFQPLKNVLILPSNEKLTELADNSTKVDNSTTKQDNEPKDVKPDEKKLVSMDELKTVDGSVTGTYHVLLENGQLQRVDYTAAPRLPVNEAVKQEPEIRSWYYTQVPADILQRYYAEYYAQQKNADYTKKPTSTNQASNSNSQGFSQSSHGFNQASNHNVQVVNQGKKGFGNFESAASEQNYQTAQRQSQNSQNFKPSYTTGTSSQQRIRPGSEVETFEPVQTTKGERDQTYPANGVVATIYYSDVNPLTGPIYTFDQTPLIRILRQA